MIRLARLLLDYSDTNIPSDIDIVLEPDGGLRGVGPLSYEARFERVDPMPLHTTLLLEARARASNRREVQSGMPFPRLIHF
ncbi:hypothetical protein D8B29_03375 [Verminephrobacter eiseniae]|nr:hypothetical protein [Verminephrobacter eiseniae]MCW5304902.1 hypothetical protein [Verminephrobacter eiseniae]MCW8178702.1 hypothetical protein [Verminephrobacter eiseniae]MCW8190680.1 hypothetical protein [Verminephrobacter eiseniae]